MYKKGEQLHNEVKWWYKIKRQYTCGGDGAGASRSRREREVREREGEEGERSSASPFQKSLGAWVTWRIWWFRTDKVSRVLSAVLPYFVKEIFLPLQRETRGCDGGRFVRRRWCPNPTQQIPLFRLRRGSLLKEDYPWMVPLEAEMMVLFDTIQAAKVGGKKPGPISGRHDSTTILRPDQLADVTCRGLLNYTSQVIQRADVGSVKHPIKTSVRGELGVASNHEVQ